MIKIITVGKHEVPRELYLKLRGLVHLYGYERVGAAFSLAKRIEKSLKSPERVRGRPKGSTKRAYFWTFVYVEVLMQLEGISLDAAANRAIEAHVRNSDEFNEDFSDHDYIKRDFLRRRKRDDYPRQAKVLASTLLKNFTHEGVIEGLENLVGRPDDYSL